MKRYAIYDLKTGHILQTHSEVDMGGRHKELSEDDVLTMLRQGIDRATVGVAAIDIPPESGTSGRSLRIDPQTRKLITTEHPHSG